MFPSNTRTATNRRNVNHQQSQFHFGLEKKGEKFICVCVSSEREGWMSNNERKRKEKKKKRVIGWISFSEICRWLASRWERCDRGVRPGYGFPSGGGRRKTQFHYNKFHGKCLHIEIAGRMFFVSLFFYWFSLGGVRYVAPLGGRVSIFRRRFFF